MGASGGPLGGLGASWGPRGAPLDPPGRPLGSSLGPLGGPLGRFWMPLGHRRAPNRCSSLLQGHKSAQNRCSSLFQGHKSASKPLLKPASRLQWRQQTLVQYRCSESLFEDASLCDTLLCSPLLLLCLPPCMDMHGFTLVYIYIYTR